MSVNNSYKPYFVYLSDVYNQLFNHLYYDPVFVKLRFEFKELKYNIMLKLNLLLDVPKECKDEKNKI